MISVCIIELPEKKLRLNTNCSVMHGLMYYVEFFDVYEKLYLLFSQHSIETVLSFSRVLTLSN